VFPWHLASGRRPMTLLRGNRWRGGQASPRSRFRVTSLSSKLPAYLPRTGARASGALRPSNFARPTRDSAVEGAKLVFRGGYVRGAARNMRWDSELQRGVATKNFAAAGTAKLGERVPKSLTGKGQHFEAGVAPKVSKSPFLSAHRHGMGATRRGEWEAPSSVRRSDRGATVRAWP
jgi:hypothetical protein